MSEVDLSPAVKAILALIQGLLPAMTAIIGGLWIVFTYVNTQNQEHQRQEENRARELRTRILESRKPFLTLQLNQYEEAANVSATLASTPVNDPDWKLIKKKFDQVFLGMSLVEDQRVYLAMEQLRNSVKEAENHKDNQMFVLKLQRDAQLLGAAIRDSILDNWTVEASGSSHN